MSRIIFQEAYTIVIPSFYEVEEHSHSMLQLFLGSAECEVLVRQTPVCGNAVLVQSGTAHRLKRENACKLFFLFDPASIYAEKAKELYLKEKDCCVVNFSTNTWLDKIEEKKDEEIGELAELFLAEVLKGSCKACQRDERISELMIQIKNGVHFHHSVSDIADQLHISESRLQHQFKESMGIPLKKYLLMNQIEFCYKLILSGKSITYAAQEAGFASSAHLAYTCKKSMGISISNVLKNSSFLKV